MGTRSIKGRFSVSAPDCAALKRDTRLAGIVGLEPLEQVA